MKRKDYISWDEYFMGIALLSAQRSKDPISIDERFLERPAFAMQLCRGKAYEMAQLSKKALKLALETLIDYDKDRAEQVIQLESDADRYEDVLGTYLVKLSSKNISLEDSKSMSIILHSISDFERISDHALDIVMSAKEIYTKKLEFSEHAKEEIKTLCLAVNDICDMTAESFCNNDYVAATHVEPLEEVIDTLSKEIKENHIKRLQKGKCTIEMGFILEDVLTGLERVSDHCSNIAVEMITIYDNAYNTHEYFKTFSTEKKQEFSDEYRSLLKKYPILKLDIE